MADSRFYRAHTAGARCAGGDFELMGKRLVAFSLCHYSLLEALFGEALFDCEPGFAALAVLAEVCSTRTPSGQFAALSDEEKARLHLVHAASFDLREQQEIWWGYLDACFLSKPFTRHAEGGGAADYRAPWTMIVVTWMLRHAHGVTRDQLWHDLPVSEVLWWYEALREQVCEVTYFAATDEPEAPPTPEEQAEEERRSRRAREILTRCMAERVAAGKLPRKQRRARLQEIDAEQARLLRELREERTDGTKGTDV